MNSFLSCFRSCTSRLAAHMFTLSAFCVFAMMLPVVLDVAMRLLADKSIPGIIEIEELIMLLLIQLGLAWPQVNNGHIQVEILTQHFSERVQNSLFLFHSLCLTVFTTFLSYYMFAAALKKYHEMEVTMDLSMPLWPFIGISALGVSALWLCLVSETLDKVLAQIKKHAFVGLFCSFAGTALLLGLPWILKAQGLSMNFWFLGSGAFLLLIAMLMLRMPIGFAMGIIGLLGLMTIRANPMSALSILSITPISVSLSFVMTVIPMFILMGEFALHAKISEELFDAASVCLGWLPGGLAISSVAGCAGFAAICGDSLATGMTMASVALPEMQRHKYNNALSCACLAAGGTLGILIPPSIGFIFYSIITEESLGRLFLAGIVPGLLLATMFSLMIFFMAKRWPELAPCGEKTTFKQKIHALGGVFPMLALVVLVLGGILFGFFSPTEGGAVGAFGTMVYALIRRSLTWDNFMKSLRSTAIITAKLMFILIGVNILGSFMAVTRMPFELADLVLGSATNKYVIFFCVVLLYMVLGCMLNVIPLMLLTLPAIFPTIIALGFDPIWFGVVTVLLMEMGLITPPVGMVVFGISGMPGAAPMMAIFKFVIPFVIVMLLCILVLTIFPDIVLFLPNLLMAPGMG